MDLAAIYLRSSKDRHDVSPDAQRRELMDLARARNLTVTETFEDAVERADDELRPGFQALLKSLKAPDRRWTHLLVMDTARIARNNQHMAAVFNYECEKRGVRVTYSKIPETNTIMDVFIRQVVRATDQLHSLMSKEKGLGGMAENVRQGWRAGGRAPLGYRLDHIPTGAIRDGAPVTKSRLVRGDRAVEVQAYLKARAAGISRAVAVAQSGLDGITASSLVGMEWNALTYAGHTVWNVHAERINGGGYKGGTKRRPRSEWVINRDTHEALIGNDEAEAIVARLDAGKPTRYRTRSEYLLSGLLTAPDGRKWRGEGDGCYRVGKGRRISRDKIESLVVEAVKNDLLSDRFSHDLVAEARRMSAPPDERQASALQARVKAIEARIVKMADLAADTTEPRPFLAQIETLERDRCKVAAELAQLDAARESAQVLRAIGERDVTAILASVASLITSADPDATKELLSGLLEQVELCPTSLTTRLHYNFAPGNLLASPRQTQQIPPVRILGAILRAA